MALHRDWMTRVVKHVYGYLKVQHMILGCKNEI